MQCNAWKMARPLAVGSFLPSSCRNVLPQDGTLRREASCPHSPQPRKGTRTSRWHLRGNLPKTFGFPRHNSVQLNEDVSASRFIREGTRRPIEAQVLGQQERNEPNESRHVSQHSQPRILVAKGGCIQREHIELRHCNFSSDVTLPRSSFQKYVVQ